ncbi:hypothetical protein SE91_26615 [Bradyrhizobium sp. DOA1]|nr:hypothetical protein SE91_26615 [Bradyrhizobium sp. DOA1]
MLFLLFRNIAATSGSCFLTAQYATSGILLCLGHGILETRHGIVCKLEGHRSESDVERLSQSGIMRATVWIRRRVDRTACTRRSVMFVMGVTCVRPFFAATSRMEVSFKARAGV